MPVFRNYDFQLYRGRGRFNGFYVLEPLHRQARYWGIEELVSDFDTEANGFLFRKFDLSELLSFLRHEGFKVNII